MQRLVYLFLMFAVAGVIAANQLDRSAKPSGGNGANAMAMATKPTNAVPASTSGDYRSVTLLSDRRGHFQVGLMVDGRSMDFLVDTGASSVALRESDAARLGYHPKARDYTVLMQTANGIAKAARVRLDRVELKGITVRDVEAIVMPDNMLGTNLLGMTFLSRVKFSHERGKLVLEQ